MLILHVEEDSLSASGHGKMRSSMQVRSGASPLAFGEQTFGGHLLRAGLRTRLSHGSKGRATAEKRPKGARVHASRSETVPWEGTAPRKNGGDVCLCAGQSRKEKIPAQSTQLSTGGSGGRPSHVVSGLRQLLVTNVRHFQNQGKAIPLSNSRSHGQRSRRAQRGSRCRRRRLHSRLGLRLAWLGESLPTPSSSTRLFHAWEHVLGESHERHTRGTAC